MASGGLSSVFVSAFPAMYQLNLLDTPKNDYWKIVSLTVVSGYFGYFFATPSMSHRPMQAVILMLTRE